MSTEAITVAVLATICGAVIAAVSVLIITRNREPDAGPTGGRAESELVAASLTELARRVDAVAQGQANAQMQLSEQLRAVAAGNAARALG